MYEAAGGDEARKVALSPTQLGSLLGGNAALGTRVVAAATALGISPAPNGQKMVVGVERTDSLAV